ncbi:hypothetical protein CPTAKMNP4_258 [Salmonella phage vB_SenM-AKM_NP4]|uniref:Uncharacterized protein n=1 Tax=Salmonella phage S16 TaxID=1087482 RepID=M1GU99_BPS16|nr:hypothetical protein I133_gp007 [Salmonella phage vB_SenM-S16]AGE48220.1 hypothetical protein [Salmonella phage vB_SenM-S16]WLI71880.1 hypothetical protein CPTAKMNP4_258 [Salmonella phage vB_SenM-AKM_NP4]
MNNAIKTIWATVFIIMIPLFIVSGMFIWEGLAPPSRVLGAMCFGIAALSLERLFSYSGIIK